VRLKFGPSTVRLSLAAEPVAELSSRARTPFGSSNRDIRAIIAANVLAFYSYTLKRFIPKSGCDKFRFFNRTVIILDPNDLRPTSVEGCCWGGGCVFGYSTKRGPSCPKKKNRICSAVLPVEKRSRGQSPAKFAHLLG